MRDNDGALVYAAAATRWVGTGRAVFDNKGQPIKQYEPYFSSVHDFEDEDELVATGVTPVLRYDPLGRLIRTDLPDGSYARTTFDAWTQEAWDPNDTTGEAGNAWTAARLPDATPTPSAEELHAAELALEHADTSATSHIDALGRVFLTRARLTPIGAAEPKIAESRTEMDIEGQVLAVRDALGADSDNGLLGRVCAESRSAIGGQPIWSSHIDSGKGYLLSDVMGAPLYAWDALGHRVRTQVDALRRVTHERNRMVMRAEFRFLRTHDGVTRFAKVAIVSNVSSAWSIALSDSVAELRGVHGKALENGLSLAIAEQDRRRGQRYAVTVTELVETAVDSSADAVECAAAVAAWKSFGGDEQDVFLQCVDERWRTAFK